MEPGATGDIAIAVLRRNGSINVPVYLWLGGAWIDFQALTAGQFSTYVDARLAASDNPNGEYNINHVDGAVTIAEKKVDGLTITRTQF